VERGNDKTPTNIKDRKDLQNIQKSPQENRIKMNTVNKPSDRWERSVGQHTDSMYLEKRKLTYKKW